MWNFRTDGPPGFRRATLDQKRCAGSDICATGRCGDPASTSPRFTPRSPSERIEPFVWRAERLHAPQSLGQFLRSGVVAVAREQVLQALATVKDTRGTPLPASG